MALEILGDSFHPFPYSVTDDEKKETAPTEIKAQRVVESYFIDGRTTVRTKSRIALPGRPSRRLASR